MYLLTLKMSNSRMIHNTASKQYTTWPIPRVAGWSLRPSPTKNSTTAMPSILFHLWEAHSFNLFPSLGDLEWIICHKMKTLWYEFPWTKVQLFGWKSIKSAKRSFRKETGYVSTNCRFTWSYRHNHPASQLPIHLSTAEQPTNRSAR